MRVVNRIEFTAKDDAEAMRLAAERLGKDAVILSTQMVKEGGLMGFFQRTVLKVTAGILEDDARESQQKPKAKVKDPRGDEDTRRETLIGFQKLLELKDRTSKGRGPLPSEGRPLTPARGQSTPLAITPTGGEGYIPTAADSPDGDTVRISSEGLRSAYGLSGPAPKPHVAPPAPSLPVAASALPVPPAPQQDETRALKEQVGALAQRVDSLLERLVVAESGGSAAEFPMAGPQRAVQPQGPAFQAGLPAQDAVLPASRLNERGLADRLLRGGREVYPQAAGGLRRDGPADALHGVAGLEDCVRRGRRGGRLRGAEGDAPGAHRRGEDDDHRQARGDPGAVGTQEGPAADQRHLSYRGG